MENEDILKKYEKMTKGADRSNIPSNEKSNGQFEIFTTFNDSKYETHTYCNIATINL